MNQPTNDPSGVNSMNQQPSSLNGFTPPSTSAAPAAAPSMPPVSAAPSTPFESSVPDLTGPTSPTPGSEGMGSNMEPMAPKSNTGLFIVLIVLVLIGGVILAVWKGWLNFGTLLGSKTPSPTPSVVATFSPMPIVNKNDSARKADMANLKTALIRYFNDKQSYPLSPVLAKASDPNGVLKVLIPTYITQLPVDPLSPNSYYGYKSDGKSFTLSASLEDQTDSSGVPMGNLYLYQVTDTSVEAPIVGPDAVSPIPVSTSAAQATSTASPSTSPTITFSPSPSVSVSSSTSSSSTSGSGSASANSSATTN